MSASTRLFAALALAVVSSLAPGAAFAQTIQEQAARPPPLPPEPGCDLWRGVVSGNDPSVLVELRLCSAGERVQGVLQWSSTLSGWNRRSLEGSWDAGHARLTMRDLAILEERPQPGWRFCSVDHYDLAQSTPGTLGGTYDSAACSDHATMSLQLISTNAPGPTDLPPATTTPAPPPVPPAAPPAGCAARCGAAGPHAAGGGATAWVFVVAGLARRRRRRRAG